MTRTSDARPLAALWHCERQDGDEKHHDSGFMIICWAHGLPYAYLVRDEVLKTAHDPDFLFWQGVGAISRAAARAQEVAND